MHPKRGHNSVACAPSRMTSLLSWIASLIKRKAPTRPANAFDAHSVVGHPGRTTAGLVAAAMSGIRSTREECARRAYTSGLPTQCLSCSGWSSHSDWYVEAERVTTRFSYSIRADLGLNCGART